MTIMKLCVVIASITLIVSPVISLNEEDMEELLKFVDECVDQAYDVKFDNPDTLRKLKDEVETADPKKEDDFTKCYAKKLKFVDEEGTLNAEGIKAAYDKYGVDAFPDTIDECVDQNETDAVSNIARFDECMEMKDPGLERLLRESRYYK